MNKRGVVAIAGLAGAAAAAIYNYLFAPAPETAFDQSYQSRLDWALAEGEKAAAQHEVALRAEFETAIQPRPALPASSLPETSSNNTSTTKTPSTI